MSWTWSTSLTTHRPASSSLAPGPTTEARHACRGRGLGEEEGQGGRGRDVTRAREGTELTNVGERKKERERNIYIKESYGRSR